MATGLINAAAGTWLENPFKGVAGTPSPGMDISAEIAAFKAANPTLGSHYNKATNTTTNNAGTVIPNIGGGPAAGAGGPNPGDPGFFTTQPVDPGPGGWQTGGGPVDSTGKPIDSGFNIGNIPTHGGGNPNPYASNGWVASGSGGTKPGAGGNELHPGPGLGGGGFNPIDSGFNINPGNPGGGITLDSQWGDPNAHSFNLPGTGGMEPNPNAQIEPFGNSRQPYGPGHPNWVNSKDGSGLNTGQTPGTGGGSPYEPSNTGSSVNLPAGWGSMGAAEKVNWFNQNNTSINALKQSGVTDAEIAWMKQNGYTGGNATTVNTVDANALAMANKVGYKLPEGWGGFTPEQKINWYNTNKARPKTLLAAGVTQAEIDWMRAHGYNVQDEETTTVPGTQPGTKPVTPPGTGSGPSGQGVWNVAPNQTVASQFASLTDPNSALMMQARARALQGMNGRGLINSTMAQTAADAAMYDAAMPIAKQDAATYADAGKTNAGFTQQWNINDKNNQLQWNINDKNNQLQREMQQASIAAQSALQSGSIQAQQALQQASQTFQGLQNGSSNATQIYAWLNDQIASIYKSDLSTDAKQKLVDQLTAQANSSLASIATLTQTLVSGAQALGLPPKK